MSIERQDVIIIPKDKFLELIKIVSSDFGFEYRIDRGIKALDELRALVGLGPWSDQ